MQYRNLLFFMFAFPTLLITEAACGTSSPPPQTPAGGSEPVKIRLKEIAGHLTEPVGLTHSNDGQGRLFIIEQSGVVRIFKNGTLAQKPFLDIRDRVVSGGEKGLLGLAFHPGFKNNRRLFVNYTTSENGLVTVISEFTSDSRLEQVNPASEKRLLVIPQPFSNHNGGQIAFGPDGKLYIGTGDGGSGNDPKGNGQNLATLLGKILRIDVDRKAGDTPYAIPKDNPFARQRSIAPEIWAYGLRNPWRFSFDAVTGNLYVGDVGQSSREEINIVLRGRNYGWNFMEGTLCTPGVNRRCSQQGLDLPIFDYPRSEGTVVIGGYVYRGSALPALVGAYLYGDFGNGRIWMLRYSGGAVKEHRLLLETARPISAFGEDADQELYVVDYSGKILKIVAQ